jgi:hypothetical protein
MDDPSFLSFLTQTLSGPQGAHAVMLGGKSVYRENRIAEKREGTGRSRSL